MESKFKKVQISVLENLVEQSCGDAKNLIKIDEELASRYPYERNVTLRNKIKLYLQSINNKTEFKSTQSNDNTLNLSAKKSQSNIQKDISSNGEKILFIDQHVAQEKKNDIKYPLNFLSSSFNKMRERLLDISSGRSKLLNLDHNNKSVIRIINEVPNDIAVLLLSEIPILLKPIPEPTEQQLIDEGYISWNKETGCYTEMKNKPDVHEWAKILGLNTQFDLSSEIVDKNNNNSLQTILFDAELNTRIKKLVSDSKIAIEETGNNILFLSLGFLEWSEYEEHSSKRYAPLYMIPVVINSTYDRDVKVNTLKYNGEEIIQNLVLSEKLKQDFGIILPDVYDDEILCSPDNYFDKVKKLLKLKQNDKVIRNWQVHRFVSLATINLGKMLMYKDLDPANWPDGDENILEHPIIRRFFYDGEQSANINYNEKTYITDDVKDLHENYPMIEDADSSQMSAVIDVLKGNNLVIEGPPGTGKSQTITNIISAALLQGKSILFVAEKQAALDVVKRRMDKAGLGDFCLDLHSDDAQKKQILDSFHQRIVNNDKFLFSENQYEREVEKYENTRNKLQTYAKLINSYWKNTKLTIHEILMASGRYQKLVSPLHFKDIAPEHINGSQFSISQLDDKLGQLDLFYNYLNIIGKQLPESENLLSHPWFGVVNLDLLGQDHDELFLSLKEWSNELLLWWQETLNFCELYKIEINENDILSEIEKLVYSLGEVPIPPSTIDIYVINKLKVTELYLVEAYIEEHEKLAKSFDHSKFIFTDEVLENLNLVNDIDETINKLQILGINEKNSLNDLIKFLDFLTENITKLDAISIVYDDLFPHLPSNIQTLLFYNMEGLKELDIFVSLAAMLPSHYIAYRDVLFDNDEFEHVLGEFVDAHESIVKEKIELEKSVIIDLLPSIDLVRSHADELQKTGLFSRFKSSWRLTKKSVKNYIKTDGIDFKVVPKLLTQVISWQEKCEQFNTNTKNKQIFDKYFQGLDTNIDLLCTLSFWYKRVRIEYGIGFGKRVAFANALFSLPIDTFRGIQTLASNGLTEEIKSFFSNNQKMADILNLADCFKNSKLNLISTPSPLIIMKDTIVSILTCCQSYLVSFNLSYSEVSAAVTECRQRIKLKESIINNQFINLLFEEKFNFKPLNNGILPTDISMLIDCIQYLKQLDENCKKRSIVELVKTQTNIKAINDLVQIGIELNKKLASTQNKEQYFFALIGSDRNNWFKFNGQALSSIIERNNVATNNEDWLDSWIKYLCAKKRMENGGYHLLNEYLAENRPSLEFAQNALKFSTYRALANEIYQEQPELQQISGHEQTALQKKFAELDESLKSQQKKRVAAVTATRKIPAGTQGAKAANYTEDALLRREIEKKTKHIAIRKLIDRAGNAMQAYKPCFMMSPMAVAKYISPNSIKFDIVIMDEASQVKPQDALSCFARGKQIVVVGDSKQLPPTAFFEKLFSNDDYNDENSDIANESESILEAIGSYVNKRQLKWHYRSQHESLIQFSNHKFYDGNLVIFPSPWNESEEYGIKFNFIKNSQFINSVNLVEAHAVIDAVRFHIIHHPNETLGVVAMNVKQRDMLESILERKLRDDKVFNDAYSSNKEKSDSLFIKNLENVQGDERDVIFISFTYGPVEKGSNAIPQRFGPINGSSGWRRLNVLFTRAKKRIQIYSSMTADQIIINDTSSLGVKSLKGYLAFAKDGKLIGQDGIKERDPDSDFEVSVMAALSKEGFECDPQVGVAGFFIDIAVRDPGMPGRYLMGIECDGATYHSSKSTRDRDRVRQGVLEGLGWNISRIWSTDFFKNPDMELKPIITKLRELSTPIKKSVNFEQMIESNEPIITNEGSTQLVEVLSAIDNDAALTLKDALSRFALNVIDHKYPDTDPNKKLLRPDMIDRFNRDRPINKEQFTELIPNYLRVNTDSKESGDFLDSVLEIIEDYESID